MPHPDEALRVEIVELLPRLRRFARALVGNVNDADDLVQMGIERALARADQWRRDMPVAGWMFGIVRNAWIDEVRSRVRQQRIFAPEALGEHIADPVADQAQWLPVQQALSRLPDEQREVIGLVLIEGLSYKEAADIVGVPVGTITSRLARAREALQRLLDEHAEEP